jgi:molybdopterin synthase sulfur carrier subunit
MEIKMRAFARFSELFGTACTVDVPEGSTVISVLRTIIADDREKMDALFTKDGLVHKHIIIVVNRARIEHDDLPVHVLGQGDELVLLPPVAGG